MLRFLLILFSLILLLVAGCASDRTDKTLGVIVDTDGSMLSTTDVNVAQVYRNRLVKALSEHSKQAAEHFAVHSDSLPKHRHDSDDFGYWAFDELAVTITVTPELALGDDEILAVADEFYRTKMEAPLRTVDERMVITVIRGDPSLKDAAEQPAAESQDPAAPTTPPSAEPKPDGPQRFQSYTIQDGDTLAAISTAFFGTPDHWRAIAAANPELDGADLKPGTVIRIPPKP